MSPVGSQEDMAAPCEVTLTCRVLGANQDTARLCLHAALQTSRRQWRGNVPLNSNKSLGLKKRKKKKKRLVVWKHKSGECGQWIRARVILCYVRFSCQFVVKPWALVLFWSLRDTQTGFSTPKRQHRSKHTLPTWRRSTDQSWNCYQVFSLTVTRCLLLLRMNVPKGGYRVFSANSTAACTELAKKITEYVSC